MRRRRSLSAGERADWAEVAGSVTPLDRRPDRAAAVPPPPPPSPPPAPEGKPDTAARRLREALPGPSSHQLDGRTETRLRRGRLHPDARIDLHGMSAAVAHREVSAFIAAAQSEGLRLVLVITGKGRPRRGEAPGDAAHGGVLRHALPHWLAAPQLRGRILLVQPAHDRHGGGGAFYVYLRRSRTPTSAGAGRLR